MTPTPRPPAAPKLSEADVIDFLRECAEREIGLVGMFGCSISRNQSKHYQVAELFHALTAERETLRGLLEQCRPFLTGPDHARQNYWTDETAALRSAISAALAADGDDHG